MLCLPDARGGPARSITNGPNPSPTYVLEEMRGTLCWAADGLCSHGPSLPGYRRKLSVPGRNLAPQAKLPHRQEGDLSRPHTQNLPPRHTIVQVNNKHEALTRTAAPEARCRSQSKAHPPSRSARIRECVPKESSVARGDTRQRSVGGDKPCVVDEPNSGACGLPRWHG